MTTYVALLRGINVAGKQRVAMGDLRTLVAALGHAEVVTHIQSGNVIFESPSTDTVALASGIHQAIATTLDLVVDVLLRSKEELAAVRSANPFLDAGKDPSKLHVTFLKDRPEAEACAALATLEAGPDEFSVCGREIYLYCPQGYGRTTLNNALWERRLKMAATTRNWNTVNTLVALAERG